MKIEHTHFRHNVKCYANEHNSLEKQAIWETGVHELSLKNQGGVQHILSSTSSGIKKIKNGTALPLIHSIIKTIFQ